MSKNAMNEMETGDTDPRASRITAIALALAVSTDYLLGLTTDTADADKREQKRRGRDDPTMKASFQQMAHIAAPLPSAPSVPPKHPRSRKVASVG
jgi:hypothetical protein